MDPKWYMSVEVHSDQIATKLTHNAKNFHPDTYVATQHPKRFATRNFS